MKFPELLDEFGEEVLDKMGLTLLAGHETFIGSAALVPNEPCRYDTVKKYIIDYHIRKMLAYNITMPNDSPFVSPVVLCTKHIGKSSNGPSDWKFAIEYRKLNAVMHNGKLSVGVTDGNLAKIVTKCFMSTF